MPLEVIPRGDQVFCEERLVNKTGLVLPEQLSDESKSNMVTHHVLATGPTVTDLRPGQRVIIRASVRPCIVEGKRFLVCGEDILAVVPEDRPSTQQELWP